MEILAIGCFHGKVPKNLKKFCDKNDIDAILCLGDYAEGTEIRRWEFKNWDEIGYRIEIGQTFDKIVSETVGTEKFAQWEDLAQRRGDAVLNILKKIKIPIAYIHGNHDNVERVKKFAGNDFVHNKIFKLEGLEIAAYGNFRGASAKRNQHKESKAHMSQQISKRIKGMNEKFRTDLLRLGKRKPDIFILHDPPYNTKCDLTGKGSPEPNSHVGDEIARQIIVKYRPKLVLCCHIHEAHGVDSIGSTTVVNVGQGGHGHAAIISLPSLHYKLVKI